MKTALLTVALLVAADGSGREPELIVFQNLGAEPVLMPDGSPVAATATSGILAGLYWLNPASDTYELLGESAQFLLAGVYAGGARWTPYTGEFTFEVRAWEGTFSGQDVSTYDDALGYSGILIGESGPFDYTVFPPSPATLPPIGIHPPGFTLYPNPIPEPSNVSLTMLGVGALFLVRRRYSQSNQDDPEFPQDHHRAFLGL